MNILEARVYVGTYAKYNNGNLTGKWLDISDYSDRDEFYEACKELHEDEIDPEYMFQGWENIPDNLISESNIDSFVWDAIEFFDGDEDKAEAFFSWIEHFGEMPPYDDRVLEGFENSFYGEWDSWETFCDDRAFEDIACQVPKEAIPFVERNFDFEGYRYELSIDYVYVDGYVFYRNY